MCVGMLMLGVGVDVLGKARRICRCLGIMCLRTISGCPLRLRLSPWVGDRKRGGTATRRAKKLPGCCFEFPLAKGFIGVVHFGFISKWLASCGDCCPRLA